MSLKIDASLSAVAHHITDGPFTFPYAIDAHQAAANHPLEWKMTPWSDVEASAAFERREANGMPEPEPPEPLSEAEQAAYDEHAKAVAEADARLRTFHERKERERQELIQVEQDEATVASRPPVRRPVATRKRVLTPPRKAKAKEPAET